MTTLKQPRFTPCTSSLWIVIDKKPKVVTLCDETYCGIGIMLGADDCNELRVGDAVTVLHYAYPTQGFVQRMENADKEGFVRVGIRWNAEN